MFRMEIDSPPESVSPSHYDLIIQRLIGLGVPEDNLKNQGQRGLVDFAKKNRSHIGALVSAILPTDDEVDEDVFRESMIWLQWLMFEDEPDAALEHLARRSADQRGVCGAVWGNNDIAYRCRTCEHDPTCAICVPCFENGNHKDHDYSVIYTGGGCCDCGDITAWKREGFCSKHKGAEQIQPLPQHTAESLGPILDLVLSYWKHKLHSAKIISEKNPRVVDNVNGLLKVAEELMSAVVEMMLDFCKHSESLLSFISGRVYSLAGLLDALLQAERYMAVTVVGKLHELLLKLLSEPIFKYEFAKVFVSYYPTVVNTAISESGDNAFKKYPLLSTFSVQILTVPTLTPRLVEEKNLLGVLFQCLENIFAFCAGEDGKLEVTKWANLYDTTLRVVEDIRFVMSHSSVPKYLCNSRRDLGRTWMRLLAYVQGMNAQKRETGSHIDDENENVHLPFVLCHSIFNILSHLVVGAFSLSNDVTNEEAFFNTYKLEHEDQDSLRHAKVGRLSQESSVRSTTGKSTLDHDISATESLPIPSSALWLLCECLKSMENWLATDSTTGLSVLSLKISNGSGNNFLALKRSLSKFRRGRYKFKSSSSSNNQPTVSSETLNKQCFSPSHGGFDIGVGMESGQLIGQDSGSDGCGDNMLEEDHTGELEGLRVLSLSDWPDITYDVSSQDISVHIPLHRLLSMVLRRSLKECFGESGSYLPITRPSDSPFSRCGDFLSRILEGCHPYGFSAFVMEHPLRIRVFCAEVHAGMWRRNGDAPILFSEWYRSVRWSEQGQELDVFLLQCCAALAPAEHFVQRVLERFGLSNYLSLNLEQSTEHESILVGEMLTLLIQIVKERRYCGLSSAESLQRELVYKLSIGDATRSQLVKSLPCDLSKLDKLQEVLDVVAEYSQPSGMTQGMYKLRPPYWKELDLYHPRWNSRDQQAAEERYLRFCNVSASMTQLPRWSKIYYPLRGIAKIATCKTLLDIIRAVFFYAVFSDKLTTSRAPDGVLLTALHLLALALDVCRVNKESGDPLCSGSDMIPVLQFASEEVCVSKYGDQSLMSLLVLLTRMHEKENYQNFMEAGNFSLSSLILNLIKSFVELAPGCMTILQKLEPHIAHKFSNYVSSNNKKDAESLSDTEQRKAKARERQAAILEKMRAQQSKFLESLNSDRDDEMDIKSEQESCDSEVDNDSEAKVICSLCHDPKSKHPVSFLVLLQKSKLLNFVDRRPPTWEQVSSSGKERAVNDEATSNDAPMSTVTGRSEMITTSQAFDMVRNAFYDFASVGQPIREVNAFMEFIKARFPSISNVQLPGMSRESKETPASSFEAFEEEMYMLIRESPSNFSELESHENKGKVLADGSSKERNVSAQPLLLGKYIAALPKDLVDNPSASQNAHSERTECNKLHLGYDKFGPQAGDGIYVSSCGHAVHQGCLDRYLSSLRERYIRRIVFEGGHIVDPDQGEFLCPVCRGLANSVLPALHADLRNALRPSAFSSVKCDKAVCTSTSSDGCHLFHLEHGLSLLQRAANIAGSNKSLKMPPARNVRASPNLEPILRLLCGMYYPGHNKILESGRVSHSLILWDVLKYSLMSAEIAARSTKTSLRPNYGIDDLFKELNSSSGFILSLLLSVIQSTRTKNSLTFFLRLHGSQLFAKSLCSGTTQTEFSSNSPQQGGNMLYILENAGGGKPYPDIQLWRRASEPVLAHDAFSSFMWVLFCLPSPMLSCKESYLSLVHVFYVVSVTQAIITYCKRKQSTESNLGFHDSLIADIYQVLGRCGGAAECFDSYYIDPSYDINDSVRSLTFPYLRRCALLWKLISSANSTPFADEVQSRGGFSYTHNGLECNDGAVEELLEVEKLEKLFNIPSLDIILSDEKSRLAAVRWINHFFEVFEAHETQGVLKCTPAIPFKLMVLPYLYQDLLQRYIKKSCPDCGTVKEEPALCLLCGKLCSPSWKPCCRESGCQTHAMACGAGIGVFLLIRRTTILLQRSARQAPWPSPYLDAFGEEDVEMHRGKPLFLNEERYAALSHMVACHGLDRSSKVLRQTTIGSFFMF